MSLLWFGLAALGLWALVRLGRVTEGPRRGQWRITATLLAAALIGGAMLAAARGAWLPAGLLAGAGLYLVVSSRLRTVPRRAQGLTEAEARAVLGVGPDASAVEIQSAWRRLMVRAHPDQGGTRGLAERLNAARDRLLARP